MKQAFTITIKGERLIELLEEEFGNIFGNIKEGDRISKMRLRYGDEVEITIGEEE